jgi:hypothetical protein
MSVYLHCPECRLTVYRPVEASAEASCPRCGGEAIWCSPPFARPEHLRFDRAREHERQAREHAPRFATR